MGSIEDSPVQGVGELGVLDHRTVPGFDDHAVPVSDPVGRRRFRVDLHLRPGAEFPKPVEPAVGRVEIVPALAAREDQGVLGVLFLRKPGELGQGLEPELLRHGKTELHLSRGRPETLRLVSPKPVRPFQVALFNELGVGEAARLQKVGEKLPVIVVPEFRG